MNLAKRIRDCRYAKGWGPDELAGRAKISRTALYQIESGKTETPRAGTLRRIALALGVTTDSLLGNEPIHLGVEDELGLGHPELDIETPDSGELDTQDLLISSRFGLPPTQGRDLERKFHALLESPLGEGVAKIVEESYRLLPMMQAKTVV
jgi:transcriptional regulator with XRE-family HTH domain